MITYLSVVRVCGLSEADWFFTDPLRELGFWGSWRELGA
jgi:hypothetical protein